MVFRREQWFYRGNDEIKIVNFNLSTFVGFELIYENYILQKSPSIQPEQKDNFSKIANKSKIFSQTYLNCGLLPPFLIPAFISDDVGRLLDHLHPLSLLLLQETALSRGHETVGCCLSSHLAWNKIMSC